eukprot:1138193-Pelagomonas_calceolata.AAC.2
MQANKQISTAACKQISTSLPSAYHDSTCGHAHLNKQGVRIRLMAVRWEARLFGMTQIRVGHIACVLFRMTRGRMQKRHPALHQKHWEQPQSLAPAGAAAAPGECAGRCVDAAPGCCEDAAAFVKSPDQTQGLTPVGVVGLVQEGSAAQGARAHCHCRMQKRRWRVCGCWDGESYEAPLKATPEMHQGQPWWQPLHRMETAAAAAAAAAAGNEADAGEVDRRLFPALSVTLHRHPRFAFLTLTTPSSGPPVPQKPRQSGPACPHADSHAPGCPRSHAHSPHAHFHQRDSPTRSRWLCVRPHAHRERSLPEAGYNTLSGLHRSQTRSRARCC